MDEAKVIVVGAGLSGLAAAYRLQQAEISVQVLEAGGAPGGRVPSLHQNGYIFDRGADAITDGYKEYFALAKEVGLGDNLEPIPSSKIGTIKNERVIIMDPGSKLSMALTPLFSWRAKLKLMLGMKHLDTMLKDIDNNHLYRMSAYDKDDETARHLGIRLFGEEVADYLVDPMVHNFNTLGAAESSTVEMLCAFALAYAKPYCLRGGLGLLPQTLADRLPVRYRCKVISVAKTSGKVAIVFHDDTGAEQRIDADGCVIATMYSPASEMYPPLAAASQDYLRHLRHMKIYKVQLAYKARTHTDASLFLVPSCETQGGMNEMLGVFLDHNKCDDRAPRGHSLITTYTDTKATEKYFDCSDEQMTTWARERVEKLLPELRGYFDFSIVTRWPMMSQANNPGYYRRAAELLKALNDDSPVQIASDTFTKTSQEAAVAWGNRAAANLINSTQKK